jgi:RNA polymerase sigma-70 factor (ECF subfamily)
MEEIYNEYFEKIYKWSLKKTNNKSDAEDLTNTIFLSIFSYVNKNIEIKKLDNLIWKIAYNLWCTKAKEYIKNNQNVTIDESLSSIKEDMIDKIIYKEIIDNLDNYKLSKNEKESFELYYFKDLSIKEIALKLNSNESNIKYYLYNARNKIKEKYNE